MKTKLDPGALVAGAPWIRNEKQSKTLTSAPFYGEVPACPLLETVNFPPEGSSVALEGVSILSFHYRNRRREETLNRCLPLKRTLTCDTFKVFAQLVISCHIWQDPASIDIQWS